MDLVTSPFPCTWSLPPILSLAVELALGWRGWGTQALSSLQLAALPSLWCCLRGKERTETWRPKGSGFICHSINNGLHLGLRHLLSAWWGAVSEEPRSFKKWGEKARYVHDESRHTGTLLCLRTLGLG